MKYSLYPDEKCYVLIWLAVCLTTDRQQNALHHCRMGCIIKYPLICVLSL